MKKFNNYLKLQLLQFLRNKYKEYLYEPIIFTYKAAVFLLCFLVVIRLLGINLYE
jgi:hypothetical protein